MSFDAFSIGNASMGVAHPNWPLVKNEEWLARGTVQAHRVSDYPVQRYFLYVPRKNYRSDMLFITVHGISRNAEEHAERFAHFAEQNGVVLIAPLFDESRIPDYQRLGRAGRGVRADIALEHIVADVRRLLRAPLQRYCMFGYSGGGQFVHRFALAYPERVAAYAIGAAGWYTFPDTTIAYPRGLGPSRRSPRVNLNIDRFLRIPALVLIGERDQSRGTAMRVGSNIESQQGESRLERALNWVAAMRTAARDRNHPARIDLQVLPRCGHSFSRCMRRADMGQRVFDWLAPYIAEKALLPE